MLTRRTLFSLASALLPAYAQTKSRGASYPSEAKRYSDPLTEFTVLRLTDPAHSAILPAACGRAVARKGGFVLHASDRSGRFEAFRMDIKTAQSKQLTEAAQLVPATLQLMPSERAFCYFDGPRLEIAPMGSLRPREVYRVEEGWSAEQMGVSEDDLYAAVIEKKEAQFRLRLVSLAKGEATTLAESAEPLSDPQPRPKRASVLYRRGDSALFVCNFDRQQNQKLRTPEGAKLSAPQWSADGREVLYASLATGANGQRVGQVREIVPDSNQDSLVARTTQFVAFGRNADGSVMVGASGSKAQPHVLLLVRSVKRELTLCEHRASDAAMVNPLFSANSQRILFQSDMHGKPAIYSMVVDKLVEETDTP
jgi:oligogalacturonide lyase